MGRAPCCDKANVKKGPWSPEEDAKLKEYMEKFGTGGNWIALPQKAGLRRCGKSCRLRWLNYLRPNIKHGEFSDEEDRIICTLYASIGSRWSIIAAQLPGRTDNDIKNYWNTKLKKKLIGMMMPQPQRKPPAPPPSSSSLSPFHNINIPSFPSHCLPPLMNLNSTSNNFSGKSLTALELLSLSPYLLDEPNTCLASTNASPSLFQTHEGLSFPMFGNNQLNGSSSDGNNGREVKQEEMFFQDYVYSGLQDSNYQKSNDMSVCGNNESDKLDIQYSLGTEDVSHALEDVKRLISSDFTGEKKTEETDMHYFW